MENRREQVKQLNAIDGIKAKWDADWGEFRVTLRGQSKKREEAVAYYTDDFDDALASAKAMAEIERDMIPASMA